MQFYTSTVNLPGIFTNADCQQTSIDAVLHMFGQLAPILAQHCAEGEFDCLELLPCMIRCACAGIL